jgi:hypothetical protein
LLRIIFLFWFVVCFSLYKSFTWPHTQSTHSHSPGGYDGSVARHIDSLPLVHFYIFCSFASFSPTVGRAQQLVGWLDGWMAGSCWRIRQQSGWWVASLFALAWLIGLMLSVLGGVGPPDWGVSGLGSSGCHPPGERRDGGGAVITTVGAGWRALIAATEGLFFFLSLVSISVWDVCACTLCSFGGGGGMESFNLCLAGSTAKPKHMG